MAKVHVSLLAMAHLAEELQPGYGFDYSDAFEELYRRLDAWIEDGQGRDGKSARAVYAASRLGLTVPSFPRTQLPKVGLLTSPQSIPDNVVRTP